jgi:hypothetical protein
MVEFYKSQVTLRQENNLGDRSLIYRDAGRRRWYLSAREKWAYGWEDGRFDGDFDFWSERISNKQSLKEVKEGACLSFSLSTAQDFASFHKAVTEELVGRTWIQQPLTDGGEQSEPVVVFGTTANPGS